MPEHHEQILDIVAKSPGSTVDDIEDLAANHSITSTDIPGLLEEAVSNGDLLEFSEPAVSWVMDGVQRYIANADDRPADEVERASDDQLEADNDNGSQVSLAGEWALASMNSPISHRWFEGSLRKP